MAAGYLSGGVESCDREDTLIYRNTQVVRPPPSEHCGLLTQAEARLAICFNSEKQAREIF